MQQNNQNYYQRFDERPYNQTHPPIIAPALQQNPMIGHQVPNQLLTDSQVSIIYNGQSPKQLEVNASKTKVICLTVIFQNVLIILAILGYRVANVFFPIIIFALSEIICFVLVLRQVKNGQASGRIIRLAKKCLVITGSLIIIASVITFIVILCTLGRYRDVGIIFLYGYTLLILLPRIIAFAYSSYTNGYVCVIRPIN